MNNRSFSDRPLVQLTLVRIREFLREPEAVFWAVFFPVLLTTGLALAFPSQPDPVLKIAATPSLVAALRTERSLDVTELEPDAAREALRIGRVVLAAEPREGGGVVFSFDDTNPDGRAARALADRALQRAAG